MNKIKAYYQDQIQFHSKRMKRAKKANEDVKRLGLGNNELHQEVYECEKQIVEMFEQKLAELN